MAYGGHRPLRRRRRGGAGRSRRTQPLTATSARPRPSAPRVTTTLSGLSTWSRVWEVGENQTLTAPGDDRSSSTAEQHGSGPPRRGGSTCPRRPPARAATKVATARRQRPLRRADARAQDRSPRSSASRRRRVPASSTGVSARSRSRRRTRPAWRRGRSADDGGQPGDGRPAGGLVLQRQRLRDRPDAGRPHDRHQRDRIHASITSRPTAGSGSHTITAGRRAVLTQAQQAQTVKLAQTIDWPDVLPASAIYGDNFDVGLRDRDTVGAAGHDHAVGRLLAAAGSTATVTSATSDCTLTATQTGDGDYAAAPPIAADGPDRPAADHRHCRPGPVEGLQQRRQQSDATRTRSRRRPRRHRHPHRRADAGGRRERRGSPYAINQGTPRRPAATTRSRTSAPTSRSPRGRCRSTRQTQLEDLRRLRTRPSTATLTQLRPGSQQPQPRGHRRRPRRARGRGRDGRRAAPTTITCAQGDADRERRQLLVRHGDDRATSRSTRRTLDVDADPASKTYGDADPALHGDADRLREQRDADYGRRDRRRGLHAHRG